MARDDFQSEVLARVAETLIQSSRLDRALEVAGLIADDSSRSQAITGVAEALVQGGQPDQANTLLDEALEVARSIANDDLRPHPLARIAQTMIQAGRLEQAIEVADLVTDEFARSQVLDDVVARRITAALDRGDDGSVVVGHSPEYPMGVASMMA